MYDELIKRLRRAASYDPRTVVQDCEDAADAIEALEIKAEIFKSAYIAEHNARIDEIKRHMWIPVTERLPMTGEKAICFGKNGYMIGTYSEFGWMFPCYFGKVTHWMHLPEKPEEGVR